MSNKGPNTGLWQNQCYKLYQLVNSSKEYMIFNSSSKTRNLHIYVRQWQQKQKTATT